MNKDIKRLDLNTPDGAQLNMDALYQIAPSVFTESRDEKTGELKRVVNCKRSVKAVLQTHTFILYSVI